MFSAEHPARDFEDTSVFPYRGCQTHCSQPREMGKILPVAFWESLAASSLWHHHAARGWSISCDWSLLCQSLSGRLESIPVPVPIAVKPNISEAHEIRGFGGVGGERETVFWSWVPVISLIPRTRCRNGFARSRERGELLSTSIPSVSLSALSSYLSPSPVAGIQARLPCINLTSERSESNWKTNFRIPRPWIPSKPPVKC